MRLTNFSALKAELRSLRELTTEQLIEGFVREAELSNPKVAITYELRNAHVRSCCAHASEIARRNELPRLLYLLESADSWLVYCAAERLSLYEEMEDSTLRALDRIVGASEGGAVTRMADLRRNSIRYGRT